MSMKKSLGLLAVVLVAVTLFSLWSSGGAAMDIQMDGEQIRFAGIGEFHYALPYEDIEGLSLSQQTDWAALTGSESARYCAMQSGSTVIYADTSCPWAIIARRRDGGQCVFNYNNEGNTKGLYEMLLSNIA